MVETVEVAALPLAPRNPLSPLQQMKAVRSFHTGCEVLRDAGGQVTRCSLAPTWMLPPVVVTTSPKGARDVLSRSYPFVDRAQPVFTEHRFKKGRKGASRASIGLRLCVATRGNDDRADTAAG